MGRTLTLFGFLFESCDTFRQLVVSSTGSTTFTTTVCSLRLCCLQVCCLRVCAFGFGALLYRFQIWSFVTARVILGLQSSRSWILVYTVLSSSNLLFSLICIFPRYCFSVLVLWSHTKYSVYLVELVFIGICCLPLWLALGYSYPLFLYVADDMRLVII